MVMSLLMQSIFQFRWKTQMIGYWALYFSQGAFLGILGPSLGEMSSPDSPIASFGPMFAGHGCGAILASSFFAEGIIRVCLQKNYLHGMLGMMALLISAWMICLPIVSRAGGSVAVSFYCVAKGFLGAIANMTINKCCAWAASTTNIEGLTRRVVNSLNGAFACGTVAGPAIAIIVHEYKINYDWAFSIIGGISLFSALLVFVTPCPQPSLGSGETSTLLGYEDNLRHVPPTLPSPISGGVFLHVKHDLGASNLNPDTYDPLSNFVVLLVTIMSTLYYGVQLGLGAFLFEYIEDLIPPGYGHLKYSACCAIMLLFWLSLAISYAIFTRYIFVNLSLVSIFSLTLLCAISVFAILFWGEQYGIEFIASFIVLYAACLSPLFTVTVQSLTKVVNEDLLQRVTSLIVFGCGCGEVFIPVLMAFFMGDYSGSMYGPTAIIYITFIITLTMMGVSGMLVVTVQKKLHADYSKEILNSHDKKRDF